jgi:hypothetical protein
LPIDTGVTGQFVNNVGPCDRVAAIAQPLEDLAAGAVAVIAFLRRWLRPSVQYVVENVAVRVLSRRFSIIG